MAFCSACGSQLEDGAHFCTKCGRPVAAEVAPESAVQAPPVFPAGAVAVPLAGGQQYAGFWLRVVARLIDTAILGIPVAFIFGACFLAFGGLALLRNLQINQGDLQNGNPAALFGPFLGMVVVFALAATILSWLYYASLESSARQATFGKSVMNLKVTDADGKPLTFGHASGRYFSKLITGMIPLGIGWMMAGFTAKKQALHDMIAGTLVYRRS